MCDLRFVPIAALLALTAGCIENGGGTAAADPDGLVTDAALDRTVDPPPDRGLTVDAAPEDAAPTDVGETPDRALDARPDPIRDAAPPDRDMAPDRDMVLDGDMAPDATPEPDMAPVPDMRPDPDMAPEPDMELEPDAWIPPGACDDPLAAPVRPRVEAESAPDFAAGDMAFDQFGRIAVIDRHGDLYRMQTDGSRELWAERVARTPRGLAFLSNGALVVADSGRGMLLLVYPGGEVRTLVDHLDAPYGLDVSHDDWIYVSEATRAAITRVEPDTGLTGRIADALPFTPTALALAPDERTLYIAARDSGVVYAMALDGADVGPVRPHAVLPTADEEGPGVCGDGEVGDLEQCDDGNGRGGDGCANDCTFDPYNGDVDAAGEVYPLVFDGDGLARVVYTTDAPGDVDEFTFTLDGPASVAIHTSNLAGDGCNGDTVVALHAADAPEPLVENDDDPLRTLGQCSRILPDRNPEVVDLPAGDYVITARQRAANRLERDGNLLVVRRIAPLQIGSPCGGADDWLACPDGAFCDAVDGRSICVADVCGDGHRAAVEFCDDGNALPGDGCADDCTFDPYNGAVDADDGTYELIFDEAGAARVVYTTDAPGDADSFGFALDAPAAIAIHTRSLGGDGCNGDTVVSLFAADGDGPIASNDDDPLGVLGACSRLYPGADDAVVELPAGEYTVVARQADGRLELDGNWLVVMQVPLALGVDDVCEGVADWLDCPFGSACRPVDGVRVCAEHICGDGEINEGEVCDDGNRIAGDGCGLDCALDPYNGEVDADDGIYPLVFDDRGEARVIFTTDAPGDIDLFGFTLDAPTAIEILTTDLQGDGCNLDTVVELEGPAGQVGRNDDDPTGQRRLCSLLRPAEIPALNALPAGDYVISARQFSRNRVELDGNWLIVRPATPVEDGGLRTDRACTGLSEGDECRAVFGEVGACSIVAGVLRCVEGEPVEPGCREAGAACETDDGRGVCAEAIDGFFCRIAPDCAADTVGDACQSSRTRGPGICERRGDDAFVCQPLDPCEGRAAGEACRARGAGGVCRDDGLGGVLYCEVPVPRAAITALDTDACGHVYAGDDVSQAVWRISPDGQTVTRLATLSRGAITALAFAPDSEQLFVGGHGGADLVSLPVGLPGRPMVLPERDDTLPDSPEDPRTFRCLDVPSAPIEITELNRPRGYHDVAFDDEGHIIGYDGTALVAVDSDDRLFPYAPGVSGVEGLDFMPDGSLIALSRNGLIRIAPNGAQQVLAGEMSGYGVTVGPDGRIYVGDNRNVLWRIDVESGVVEPFLDTRDLDAPFQPRNIAFDLDASLMYIGEFGPRVFALSLDKFLEPLGTPRYFTTVQPDVRWVDGLTVDACGQVYAPNFETATLMRSTPDGETRLYHQWPSSQYGHNVTFGSGIGRWRTDALYLPQPYDNRTVVEVVVGVEGAVLEPIAID